MYFTSCNSMVALHGLMSGKYFFYYLKKNYFSCSTLTASSNTTWLHALSAEATAAVLGGKERAPVVIWRSTTTQKVVLTPEGRAAGNG